MLSLTARRLCVLFGLFAVATPCLAQGWWMTEPVRLLQVNLPGHMVPEVDPTRLIEQVEDISANTLMINMGGIVANYPTELSFHVSNPALNGDFFGEVLEAAHARGIRVIGRFDFSRAQRPVFEAHPEWFFLKSDGSYVVDENGIYATCINGGYYREAAFQILEEALTRYPVDGLFFNMFGDAPVNYYTGDPLGTCRSPDNVARFEEKYGRPIPDDYYDPDYREFMRASSSEVAVAIGELIHRIRPDAGFMTYLRDEVDVIMDETAMARAAVPPLWTYFASVNVDRARSTYPDKMIFNLVINFESFRHRFASVPEAFSAASLYQNMAHGGIPAFVVVGTFDQPDPRGLEAAREVFRRHAATQDLYVGQKNAARVVVVGRYHREPAFRGIVHMLSELHIPYVIRDDLAYLERPDQFDLVITTSGAAPAFREFLHNGGRVLVTGTVPPDFDDFPPIVRRWDAGETAGSYWRVNHSERFSSLDSIDLIPLEGEYLEFAGYSPLTLVPPATYSPPDVVAADQHDSDRPGLLLKDYGEGRLAYLPWEIGQLYYEKGSPAYRALLADLIDELLPYGRQIETDAHPLVEITLMEQPGRALVHLVNLSGYTGSTFHHPVPMQNLTISVKGTYSSAQVAGEQLRVEQNEGRTSFTVPSLGAYEVVVLESPLFDYHRIDNIGGELGQTSLVDVDNDGDLDWIAGQSDRRGGEIWWWEYRGPDEWVRHFVGKGNTDVGGSAFDVNGDGWIDILSGSKLLLNSGSPRTEPFQEYDVATTYSHDTEFADVNGDGRMDAIANWDEAGLFWYEIPPDPRAPWTQHLIASSATHEIHGGVSPRAVGDIDGDGDNDVVTGQAWYENVDGRGLDWRQHKNIELGEVHQYGLAVRTWVADLDGDGDLDVVQSEADNPDGRVAWFENDGRGNWHRHIIKDKGDGQDFHSLAVADMDLDGDMDVVSGGGPLSAVGTHKIYLWENLAGPGGNPGASGWREHIIARKPVHEIEVGDVDGDGDPDLVGKPWSVGNEHFYLLNLTVESRSE